jgi:signal transduction histidine kinase
LTIAVIAGWTSLAARIDNYAYDFLSNLYPPGPVEPQSLVLSVDEETLNSMGDVRHIRSILAEGLERLAPVHPKAIAIDFLLINGGDPDEDARLTRALAAVRDRVVLSCEMVPKGWEDPLPAFRQNTTGVGHVHADKKSLDGISRAIPLEQTIGHDRRWALSLEAFHVAQRSPIIESPDDLQVGDTVIPAPRGDDDRALRIRYQRAGSPVVSIHDLVEKPQIAERFRGKTVFIGYTALSYVHDRLYNPYGDAIPGVVIHSQAFETMAHRQFLVPASNLTVLAICLGVAAAAGLIFAFLNGWPAYACAGALIAAAHFSPALFFRSGVIYPYFISLSTAWLTLTAAAAFHYFVVRRALRTSESDRARYQQAIHFVTHEMKTPLTAIQGSSELMGRYNLSDEKRKQMAVMINSESKRLARMIQTFLDVERLTAGQMELRKEPFPVRDLIRACLDRVRPLAERKQIAIHETDIAEAVVTGDRELMEYAFYNLLTNAVKYSPAERDVFAGATFESGLLRLSVKDQGIGMDAKELKNIFQKFYRTKKAEASGEGGTGIGLSIVEQIVTHHGGRMEVTSSPGVGSTFTMVLPAQARVHSEDMTVPQAG